jgi:hypothetical protein
VRNVTGQAKSPPMQRIHNDRDRADDGRHLRKNRQGPQDAFSTAGPAAFAGDAITRLASLTHNTEAFRFFLCPRRIALPLFSTSGVLTIFLSDNIPIAVRSHEGREPVAPARVERTGARGRGEQATHPGRRRDSAWRPIRAARQELADGGRPSSGGSRKARPDAEGERRTARRRAPRLRKKACRSRTVAHLARRPPTAKSARK